MPVKAHIDSLRDQYTQTPHIFDCTISEYKFSDKERALIERYGNWFEAIWRGEVPLLTEKLKHFYAAKDPKFQDRTQVEQIWFLYDKYRVPF